MAPSLGEQARGSLNEACRRAERIIAEAEADAARTAGAGPGEAAQDRTGSSIARLERVRSELARTHARIDDAEVRLVESLADAAVQLLAAARTADFSPPPWPDDIGRTLELKLSETREATFRFAPGRSAAQAAGTSEASGGWVVGR